MANAIEALGINAGNLFINILCFAIAFVIIVRFIAAPIQKMITARKAVVDKGLSDAQAAALAHENAQKDYDKMIADARTQSATIIKEATDQVAKMKADHKAAIDEESSKQIKDAADYIQKERELMLTNLRSQVIDLSVTGAKKIIGATLLGDEEKQHTLLQELFTGMKEGKVPGLDNLPRDLKEAEVTTALPLTEDEQKTVRLQISPELSSNLNIDFVVNPKILGGIIIQSGDYLLDASVLGKAQELKDALHK